MVTTMSLVVSMATVFWKAEGESRRKTSTPESEPVKHFLITPGKRPLPPGLIRHVTEGGCLVLTLDSVCRLPVGACEAL